MGNYDHKKIEFRWPRKNSTALNLTGQAEIFDHKKIDAKWQAYWQKNKLFEAIDFDQRPKNYILVEFPYPSGEGLHTGHCRSYTALDIIARKRRMQGFNVLFPIGWDAFGLPTENYAIKTGIHPLVATKKNTDYFRRQLKSLGFSFDWSREINTTDPEYYQWTQWIFLQLYKKGLAYKAKMPINFCPSCKIGLANEEAINGKCERCGAKVIKKEMEQWMLAITKYADRLISDLDKVDYQEKIKKQQINWIGRSRGATVKFEIRNPKSETNSKSKIQNSKQYIKIFTTRPDTLPGATYMVLSPEHELIKNLKSKIKNLKQVDAYIQKARQKSDIERIDEKKEKTGVELKGIKAINPLNKKEIPVFVADYVLSTYGTGAIMAVPAHDERDRQFAKKFNLPVINCHSVLPSRLGRLAETDDTESDEVIPNSFRDPSDKMLNLVQHDNKIDSRFRGNDMRGGNGRKDAIKKMILWLEKKKLGKKSVNYKLRDWVFSRQHYWGEPMPVVFCPNCKKQLEIQNPKSEILKKYSKGEIQNPGWIMVEEKDLPVELPMVEKYEPTETGESPLANIKNWVETQCPKCKGSARRETDTMPNWAGSSWYYLAYVMRGNPKFETRLDSAVEPRRILNPKLFKYWLPVDWYNGGMEHTTLHLLYSRFWYKFLSDIKVVPTDEPYQKRTSQGMVLGEGGIKMSKSKGNVINPDDIVQQYGADTLRLYEMFMGPFGERVVWDTKGILGVKRFLDKVWRLFTCHSVLPSRLGRLAETDDTESDEVIPNSFRDPSDKMLNQVQHDNIIDSRFRGNDKQPYDDKKVLIKLNQTIKKVSDDIESMSFNTALSAMMEFVNEAAIAKVRPLQIKEFLILLSPFAPHISEELWQKLGRKESILKQKWPKADKKYLQEKEIIIAIQVNGRLRDTIRAKLGTAKKEIIETAKKAKNVKKYLGAKKIKKEIYIKDRLVNFVI